MLRKIKIPFIMWLLLTSILFTPMIVEFKYNCDCDRRLTQEQKDDIVAQKTIEFNKAIEDGQIPLISGWWFLFFVLYIVFYAVRLIIVLIQMDEGDGYPILWNLKYLETKEGSYFYRINKKTRYVEVFKQNILTYQRYDRMKIYDASTTEITNFLNDIASNIDEENLSFISEEMSTWKRFKTK